MAGQIKDIRVLSIFFGWSSSRNSQKTHSPTGKRQGTKVSVETKNNRLLKRAYPYYQIPAPLPCFNPTVLRKKKAI